MSGFIVISLKERLNWIIDSIKENLPLNPQIPVNFSYGKIKKDDKDGYLYEYLSYSSSNTEDSGKPTEESDTPINLFNNQIGHFRTIADIGENNLNVFCLDNPLNEEELEESIWLLNALKALYDSKKQTNFQIIRIVFSYNLDKPENLNLQASTKILKDIIKTSNQEFNKDLLIRTCYIDNQNQYGAAVALDKKHHDLLIPRMLGDFMMLLSDPNDQYNTFSAIIGPTDIFSLGYAESMYYFEDIKRFYELSHRKKFLEKINDDKNEEKELNYDKKPFGLKNRISRLEGKFNEVPFNKDISVYPDSVDKKINDIIETIKPFLIEFIQNLSNSDEAEELKKSEYRFIDRKKIFEDYQLDESSLDKNIKDYKKLLDLSLSKDFKKYLKDRLERTENTTNNDSLKNNLEDRPGCNPFKKIFWKRKKIETKIDTPKTEVSPFDWKILNDLDSLCESKEKFNHLKFKQKEIESEIRDLDQSLKNFKFTPHSKSIDRDNLVDLNKLKQYHSDNYSFDKILNNWDQRKEENQNLSHLLNEELSLLITEDSNKFQFINWQNTFPFIKSLDLKAECEALKRKSVPFVRLFVLPEKALNLITYNIYSDNKTWIDNIKDGQFEISEKNLISAINSSHIASKICMFQFLQMTPEIVAGIVDTMQKD